MNPQTFLIPPFLRLPLLSFARLRVCRVLTLLVLQNSHRLRERLFLEFPFLVHHQVNPVPARREKVVLQWSRSEVGVDDVTRLLVRFTYPFRKLHRIWDGDR